LRDLNERVARGIGTTLAADESTDVGSVSGATRFVDAVATVSVSSLRRPIFRRSETNQLCPSRDAADV
jgi:membrane-bound lytic murein transglycosylase B